MKSFLPGIKEAFLHLFYPHLCVGCARELPAGDTGLCGFCLLSLAETGFETQPENAIEKNFWGRLPLRSASASFYFQRETLIQELMHRLKYGSDRHIGLQLGQIAGCKLLNSDRFKADFLVPLPLSIEKQRSRGYNQAMVLCEGMAVPLGTPILHDVIIRNSHTESQTSKSRTDRWQNMEGRFEVQWPAGITGKHLLLVDDVITTGATLEACGQALLQTPGVTLSIATLCYAARI